MDTVYGNQRNTWLLCQTVLLWFHLHRLFPDEEGVNSVTTKTAPSLCSNCRALHTTEPRTSVYTFPQHMGCPKEARGVVKGLLSERTNEWSINGCYWLRVLTLSGCATNSLSGFSWSEIEIHRLLVIFDWVFCTWSQIHPDIKIKHSPLPPTLSFFFCYPSTAKEVLLAIIFFLWREKGFTKSAQQSSVGN